MTASTLWTLPVPSTALLGGGPVFEVHPRREVALRFLYEGEDDAHRSGAVVFQGVEAYKCTYYRARDASMHEAYDRLVDRGASVWLEEVRTNLRKNGGDGEGLVHMMMNFDDGPAYEVVCRSFRIEDGAQLFEPSDMDVPVKLPEGLLRIVKQNLVNVTPWHVMSRDLAVKRLHSLRQRYSRKYVPFARRQDNDDLACIDPAHPDEIVIVHDFASEGTELRKRFGSFWEWFHAAVEDMVLFE